ncbi:hypothetical protein TNCV_3569741 [Trichonephila clavipes]|nr:hypothetical protein TNCV_3569741 [Trichonephila clavipes]
MFVYGENRGSIAIALTLWKRITTECSIEHVHDIGRLMADCQPTPRTFPKLSEGEVGFVVSVAEEQLRIKNESYTTSRGTILNPV